MFVGENDGFDDERGVGLFVKKLEGVLDDF